nr:hypothetical protein [Tanacetum cinerariifolium]
LTSCLNSGRLLGSLKILKLSHCYQLRSLGGFHELPLLEMLLLKNCMNLTNVCESIQNCDELILIDLTYCKEFKKFLGTLANLKKVKTVLLNGCSLGESSPNIRDMDSLRTLNAAKNGIPRDSQLEFLSMCDFETLMSIERPPRPLRLLSYNFYISSVQRCETLLRKIAFDPEKSPLDLFGDFYSLATSSIEFEGTIKIQPMAGVEETILHSLGWSNLEFINKQGVETYDLHRAPEASQTQMYYEYGIFSTIYEGELIPNWIEHRNKGPSVSFSIPTSPKKLTGMNFCYVQTKQSTYQIFDLPHIIISNITKKHTLIYKHYIRTVNVGGHSLTFLSHWMFRKNEMEDGDQLTVSIEPALCAFNVSIRECGVSFVYDDDDGNIEEEEDPLSYYKSWNQIIGGDLSAFQLTTEEYLLDNKARFEHVLGPQPYTASSFVRAPRSKTYLNI